MDDQELGKSGAVLTLCVCTSVRAYAHMSMQTLACLRVQPAGFKIASK